MGTYMLLVGITYDKEIKKHVCKIERVAEKLNRRDILK